MEDSASQWAWTFMKENAEKPTDTTKERKVKIEKVRKETNEIFHINQIGTAMLGTIGLIESDKKESEHLEREKREIKEESERRTKKIKNPLISSRLRSEIPFFSQKMIMNDCRTRKPAFYLQFSFSVLLLFSSRIAINTAFFPPPSIARRKIF